MDADISAGKNREEIDLDLAEIFPSVCTLVFLLLLLFEPFVSKDLVCRGMAKKIIPRLLCYYFNLIKY